MADYTFGDYVSFINMTDTTNEYHDSLILNQIHDMHITSPLKFMAEIFESFPNLFIDHMFKLDECPYPNCGSVIKTQFTEKR